jgi:hypothetical protein
VEVPRGLAGGEAAVEILVDGIRSPAGPTLPVE